MSTGTEPYTILYSKKAHKQIPDLKSAGLDKKVRNLIDVIREDPLQEPPPYEELRGDLMGLYSRRINIHHRLVYEILEDRHAVRILSMWTHYQALHA